MWTRRAAFPGRTQTILSQLAQCGLHPDGPVVWQSQRSALYQQALDSLIAQHLAYPCACSRKEIEAAQLALGHAKERHAALPYPGTCRQGLHGRSPRAWRFNTTDFYQKVAPALTPQALAAINSEANFLPWTDRRLGRQVQDVVSAVGDFVLKRADGLWAYQLAVVVDDAAQSVTHIVRGEDLADNTPRQILLQKALGLPTPAYLHTPLVLDVNGGKTLQTKRRCGGGPVQPAHGVEPGGTGSGFTRSGRFTPHFGVRCACALGSGLVTNLQ